jgi:leucyl-tRNA synthetase
MTLSPIHVDVSMVNSSDELDENKFKSLREEYKAAEFICDENGKYIVGRSRKNVQIQI